MTLFGFFEIVVLALVCLIVVVALPRTKDPVGTLLFGLTTLFLGMMMGSIFSIGQPAKIGGSKKLVEGEVYEVVFRGEQTLVRDETTSVMRYIVRSKNNEYFIEYYPGLPDRFIVTADAHPTPLPLVK